MLKDYLVSSKNRSIPPLQTDDDLICDKFAKCELINDFFSEQSNLDDSNSTVPEPIDPLYDKLTQLHITETDIEDVLQLLDTEERRVGKECRLEFRRVLFRSVEFRKLSVINHG